MARELYEQQTWENLPSENTPITAERLAHIEEGIRKNSENMALKELYGDNTINVGRRAGTAEGRFSTAEGSDTVAVGTYSHAEGHSTEAYGYSAHAEGYQTVAGYESPDYSQAPHAEGGNTLAAGHYAHAEGYGTKAGEDTSVFAPHAEGCDTTASGYTSHAEGCNTTASGYTSHAEGYETVAGSSYQHVQGKYNIPDTEGIYAHIVGGGSENTTDEEGNAVNNAKNIHTLDWQGNAVFAGNVTDGKGDSIASVKELAVQLQTDIEEVFTSVSDGKKLIASAVTDKGVYTDADATFATMAQNIKDIPTKDSYEVYEGDYNLVPKVLAQSVETKDKLMKDNVTVAEIPFHEVSNETGKTAIIGGIL